MSEFQDLTSEKIDRMARDIAGEPLKHNASGRCKVDPYEQKEVVAEILHGREKDHYDKWHQVMEYFRFVYLTPEQLNAHPLVGPMRAPASVGHVEQLSELAIDGSGTVYQLIPHTEPQWRRFGKFADAFTPRDLITLFIDEPARFDRWFRDRILRRMMREAGIVAPDQVINKYNRATRRALAAQARQGGSSSIILAKR